MKNKALLSIRQGKNIYGQEIDIIEHSYIRFLEKFDLQVVVVSNATHNLNEYLKEPFRIIILSGGNDVEKKHIQKPFSGSIDSYKLRDKIEYKLIKFAISKGIPLIGICRGFYMLNCYFGGKVKFIPDRLHIKKNHQIDLLNNKLIKIIKKSRIKVNSYHDFGISEETLSKDFNIMALHKKTRIIEAIIHKKFPIIGVQWHPERNNKILKIDYYILKLMLSGKIFELLRK